MRSFQPDKGQDKNSKTQEEAIIERRPSLKQMASPVIIVPGLAVIAENVRKDETEQLQRLERPKGGCSLFPYTGPVKIDRGNQLDRS